MIQSIFHHTRSHYIVVVHFWFMLIFYSFPRISKKEIYLVPLYIAESRLCHRTRIFLIIEEIKWYFMERSKTFV